MGIIIVIMIILYIVVHDIKGTAYCNGVGVIDTLPVIDSKRILSTFRSACQSNRIDLLVGA